MGVTKKSVPQQIPVKIAKKNTKKKTGEELICKNFGVNGRVARSLAFYRSEKGLSLENS